MGITIGTEKLVCYGYTHIIRVPVKRSVSFLFPECSFSISSMMCVVMCGRRPLPACWCCWDHGRRRFRVRSNTQPQWHNIFEARQCLFVPGRLLLHVALAIDSGCADKGPRSGALVPTTAPTKSPAGSRAASIHVPGHGDWHFNKTAIMNTDAYKAALEKKRQRKAQIMGNISYLERRQPDQGKHMLR